MWDLTIYLVFWFQSVHVRTTPGATIDTLPLIISTTLSSAVSGFIVTQFGRLKFIVDGCLPPSVQASCAFSLLFLCVGQELFVFMCFIAWRDTRDARKNVLRGTSKFRIASAAIFAPDLNVLIACFTLSSFSRDSDLI